MTSKTGIQGFWNYDTFSLLGPMAGRSQAEAIGLINTYTLNLCFTQTDIVLKWHNNPPILTRIYNSETQNESIFFHNGGNDRISFIGKDWMLNYEHCLIEDESGQNPDVYEIDPTGARNTYTYSSTDGTYKYYAAPAGIFKTLRKHISEAWYEIQTRDYTTYRFSGKKRATNIDTAGARFFGLDWIKDKNGVKVIITWETAGSNSYKRISYIEIGSDYDSSTVKVIEFLYTTDLGTDFWLMNSYKILGPQGDDNPKNDTLGTWLLGYDSDTFDLLTVDYPITIGGTPGTDNKCFYEFKYDDDNGKLTWIFDMNRVLWEFIWEDGIEDPVDLPSGTYNVLKRIIYPEVSDSSSLPAQFSEIDYYIDTTSTLTTYLRDAVNTDKFWVYVHDANGRIESRTDPLSPGNTYSYQWTTAASKWVMDKFTFPSGDYVVFDYDATTANLTEIHWWDEIPSAPDDEKKAYNVKYEWDSTDIYLLKAVRYDNDTETNLWWSSTEFTYDDKNVVKIRSGIPPTGGSSTGHVEIPVIRMQYTQYGNVSSITDPEDITTEFEYSETLNGTLGTGFGALKKATLRDRTSDEKPAYYAWDRLETLLIAISDDVINENLTGCKFRMTYSQRGELLTSNSIGSSSRITYDKMSNPVNIWSNTNRTIIDYQLETYPLNMPVEITINTGNVIKYVYNAWGDRTEKASTYDGDEYKVFYNYDDARRLEQIDYEILSASGGDEKTVYEYDSNSNVTKVHYGQYTDGTPKTLYEMTYNFAGQLIETKFPAITGQTNKETYSYDGPKGLVDEIQRSWTEDGNLKTATWTYEYDRLGRCVNWTKPTVPYNSDQAFSVEYFYDRNSRLVHIKNTRDIDDGEEHTYSYRHEYYKYDTRGRLTRIYREIDDDVTTDVALTYDTEGNLVQSTSGGIVAVSKKYDDAGRVVAMGKPGQDLDNQGTRYVYDANGRVCEMHMPGNAVYKIDYDEAGRVCATTDPCGRTFRREYWENGLLKRLIYPSGDFIGYEYDGLGRIIKVWETVPDINLNPSTITDNPWGINRNRIALTLEVTYEWDTDMNLGKCQKVTYKTAYSTSGDPSWNMEYYTSVYLFNQWGWLEKVSFPQEGATTSATRDVYRYTYNYRGNVKSVELYDGGASTWRQIIDNSYDKLGRMLTHEYSEWAEPAGQGGAPTRNVTNTLNYCCCSLVSASQTNSTAGVSTRSLAYTRDKRHRLLGEEYSDTIPGADSGSPVIKDYSYVWDNASRLVKFIDPVYGADTEDPKPTVYNRGDNTNSFTLERIDPSNPDRAQAESYHYEFGTDGRISRVLLPDADNLTGEGENASVMAIDYSYFPDGKVQSINLYDLVNDASVYYIAYEYDMNGRMSDQKVKKQKAGKAFVYRVRFTHDGRGQLKNHTYEKYVSVSNSVELIRRMEIWYDLAGNIGGKKFTDNDYDWVYEFTYDTGYRLTGLVITNYDAGTSNLNWTYTYDFDHDLRGNVRACSCVVIGPSPEPRPVDLPNTMKYDSHNRLSEYTVTGSRKIALRYDPVSRVFRREVYTGALLNTLESAVHYYYQGGEVVQEFDEMLEGEPESQTPIDAINWDYLRGYHGEVIRRREVDGETYTDMLQVVDHQGSVKQEASPDVSGTVGAENGYATHAEGEPLPIEQPSDIANHVQFHGGILEDSNIHTNPATDGEMGYFYRMGVRHYSPGLHRFIQRDPLSYIRVPGRSTPLSLNPYIYGMNRPDQLSDVSGYQAGPGNVAPCSGCVGSGQVGGGFGTDGGHGPVVPPQGGNGGSGGSPQPESGDDKRTCLRSLPEDCFREDPAWQMCNVYLCCQWDDEPPWASCCARTVITPGFCLFEDREECLCGCCSLSNNESHSPNCIGIGHT
jgi:RHS repeat-associated protein